MFLIVKITLLNEDRSGERKELLRHARLATTMIYTEVNNRNLRETVSPMDALMRTDLDAKEENY